MKKAVNSFLIMCLITAQFFLPMKAYAFPPALVWAFGASVSLHAGALLFKLDDVQAPVPVPPAGSSSSGGGISFKLNGKPSVTPQGWPDPTTPPSSANKAPHTETATAHCKAAVASVGAFYVGVTSVETTYAVDGTFGYRCNWRASNGNTGNWYYRIKPTCTAGYALVSGVCQLQTPELVKKPAGTECEFVYKAGNFVPDPQNPACDGKATNTISRTGCDLTTTFEKMSMSCPSTNSSLEMTPTQLSGTSESVSFSVPATVDENGAYTISVPSDVKNIRGFDDRDLQNLSSFTGKITVDAFGSVNGSEWGCIGGSGVCSHVSVDPRGGGGGTLTGTGTDFGGTTGGSTGGTGGTGGDTGTGTGTGTGDGSGTGTGDGSGTGTGDASGDLAGIGDIEGWIDGAVGKIKSFFSGGADDVAPSSTPISKTDVPVQLKSGDGFMAGGQCPPPTRITVQFYGPATTIEIPYAMFCDLASMLKPVVVTVSYLAAGYIIFRRD